MLDREDRACLRRSATDGAVVVAAYAALAAWDGRPVTACRLACFWAAYVAATYGLKKIDAEFADQLPRVVGFQLGSRLFNLLLP